MKYIPIESGRLGIASEKETQDDWKDYAWWSEEVDLGRNLGYGLDNGRSWIHLYRIRDAGPRAISIEPLCRYIKAEDCLASYSEDQEEITKSKLLFSLIPVGGSIDKVLRFIGTPRPVCKKCRASYLSESRQAIS